MSIRPPPVPALPSELVCDATLLSNRDEILPLLPKASLLGFYQADLFHGTIQSCGSEFFEPVEHVNGQGDDGQYGNTYGLTDATNEEIDRARKVRFALVTGNGDFRHGDILDIYYGGLAKLGFRAKLFDVPGMGHVNADGPTLDAVLNFIEDTP